MFLYLCSTFRGDIKSSPKNVQGAQTFSLCEIVMELSDDAEAVRGHALLTLAKGVRKRNKQFLNELDSMPGIMFEVMSEFIVSLFRFVFKSF